MLWGITNYPLTTTKQPSKEPYLEQEMTSQPFIDFEGKRVVVSGATSGIGKSIAITLSQFNASVILIGRNPDKLDRTVEECPGTNVESALIDLHEIEEINDKIRDVAKQFGPIYGLCHAAGMVETCPLSAFKNQSFQRMMDVNLTAGIELTKAICRRDVMTKEGGAVLFISSVYGLVGMPGQIGYSATKGAVHAAARAMAIELARRNVRVNVLSPGFVKTPMTEEVFAKLPAKQLEYIESLHPLGAGTPEDVASASAFLLAPQNRWITGTNFIVDGGYTSH
jgi:NAD(P)-dependent dehydrogenase (short-subunit alcohol dehydrogenase family)